VLRTDEDENKVGGEGGGRGGEGEGGEVWDLWMGGCMVWGWIFFSFFLFFFLSCFLFLFSKGI
jgi:hypothetical protein